MSINKSNADDPDYVEGFTKNGRHYFGHSKGNLREPCPFENTDIFKRYGPGVMVGSAACGECQYFKGHQRYSDWIKCKLFAEQEGKESVTLINF